MSAHEQTRIAQLTYERDQFHDQWVEARARADRAEDERDEWMLKCAARIESSAELSREVSRLREALGFYADEDNYEEEGAIGTWSSGSNHIEGEWSEFNPDNGYRARAALASSGEPSEEATDRYEREQAAAIDAARIGGRVGPADPPPLTEEPEPSEERECVICGKPGASDCASPCAEAGGRPNG